MKPKKCKICKQTYQPTRPLQQVCGYQCANKYSQKQVIKDWTKRKKVIKEDLTTVQELMKLTQVVFNTYIRQRDKGQPCISCGNTKMKKINACHYYSSGGHKNLTYNEDNCFSGCEYCNTYLHGNLIEYRKHLITKIGIDRVEWLDENAHVTRKYSREDLRDLIAKYKKKTKELK